MSSKSQQNKELGLRINREIWNEPKFENIPLYFSKNFVADYSPRVMREGRDQIEQMVRSAHDTFEGFHETVQHVVADDTQVALHFTITGWQVKDLGPVAATNKLVKYDEVVILQVRHGKVCRQIGVSDTLLALQQLGRIPDPAGLVGKSLAGND